MRSSQRLRKYCNTLSIQPYRRTFDNPKKWRLTNKAVIKARIFEKKMADERQSKSYFVGQPFEQKILTAFAERARSRTLAKGEYLIKEGDVENNLYLVESGALRVFYLTEYEEMIVRFGYKGSMITSLSSFIKGTPSEFYIEAIRKTEVKVIAKEAIDQLVNESVENLREYAALLELLITQQTEREIDLLINSPTERLNRVLKRSPNLFQEIPLKYIASYLRMTPETLSRIRNS